MLELLNDYNTWCKFLDYKLSHKLMSKREETYFREYIQNRKYEDTVKGILDGSYVFSYPQRNEINKLGTSKKRVVYTFSENENMILKLLAYLLHKYDDKLCDNCYAFRCNIGAREAFLDMLKYPDINDLWCFKSDITNYFNSIDVTVLESVMRDVIDDEQVLKFILTLLKDDRSESNGNIIHEQKGVMAGTPISPFLANLYLMEMDKYFAEKNVRYARYSDDIIIFDNKDKLDEHISDYRKFLNRYHLVTNPAKEVLVKPNEAWTFLGFSYSKGKIDISDAAAKKLIGKIRRASHSLRRWMIKKDVDSLRTLKAFNRKFNRKFYTSLSGRELCWSRWYFPIINCTDTLSYIDRYMQECQRFIVTGKHNKLNYEKVPYSTLKECGYKPLVTEYYTKSCYKAQNNEVKI